MDQKSTGFYLDRRVWTIWVIRDDFVAMLSEETVAHSIVTKYLHVCFIFDSFDVSSLRIRIQYRSAMQTAFWWYCGNNESEPDMTSWSWMNHGSTTFQTINPYGSLVTERFRIRKVSQSSPKSHAQNRAGLLLRDILFSVNRDDPILCIPFLYFKNNSGFWISGQNWSAKVYAGADIDRFRWLWPELRSIRRISSMNLSVARLVPTTWTDIAFWLLPGGNTMNAQWILLAEQFNNRWWTCLIRILVCDITTRWLTR
jgi:hypothetical protein